MADRTVTVGPGKTYSDLGTALSTEGTTYYDLVANQMIITFECYAMEDDLTGTSTPILVTGWTSNSSYYVRIKGADSDKTANNVGKWSTERYRIKSDTNYGCLQLSSDYTRVEDIQSEMIINATASWRAAVALTAVGTRAERCISRGTVSGTNTNQYIGFAGGSAAGTRTIINCLAYDFHKSAETRGRGFQQGNTGTTLNVYNCTAYNTYRGFEATTGTANWRNCGSSVHADVGFSGGSQTTCSTTAPTFKDAGNRDLHLDASDTTWTGVGTDYSGTYTTDIDGQTRTVPFSIGCDQYVAAAQGDPGSVWIEVKL